MNTNHTQKNSGKDIDIHVCCVCVRPGLHRLVAKVTLYEADTLTPCTQMNKPWEMRCVAERDSEVRDLVSRKVRKPDRPPS